LQKKKKQKRLSFLDSISFSLKKLLILFDLFFYKKKRSKKKRKKNGIRKERFEKKNFFKPFFSLEVILKKKCFAFFF
jgi:hypothetical protein